MYATPKTAIFSVGILVRLVLYDIVLSILNWIEMAGLCPPFYLISVKFQPQGRLFTCSVFGYVSVYTTIY